VLKSIKYIYFIYLLITKVFTFLQYIRLIIVYIIDLKTKFCYYYLNR